MHLSDLKDMCTYVCNMHSLLMHTEYTVISANLNLLTKHTLAIIMCFSFPPGELYLFFLFTLITYCVPSLLIIINLFNLRLKPLRLDHVRLLPN